MMYPFFPSEFRLAFVFGGALIHVVVNFAASAFVGHPGGPIENERTLLTATTGCTRIRINEPSLRIDLTGFYECAGKEA
jgi:hypothetical protein